MWLVPAIRRNCEWRLQYRDIRLRCIITSRLVRNGSYWQLEMRIGEADTPGPASDIDDPAPGCDMDERDLFDGEDSGNMFFQF